MKCPWKLIISVSHSKHLQQYVFYDQLPQAFEDVCMGTELENMGSLQQFTPMIHEQNLNFLKTC